MLPAASRTRNSSGEVSRISSTEPATNWNSSAISARRARASASSTRVTWIAALPLSMPSSTWPKRPASRPKASAAWAAVSSPANTVLTEPRMRSASSNWRWATATWLAGAPLCSRISTTFSYSTCNCGTVSARVAATWCSDSTVCSLARMVSVFLRRFSQSRRTASISSRTMGGAGGRPVDLSPSRR
ncbi:hypothetical protein D3C76_1113190 [compost metagenome]